MNPIEDIAAGLDVALVLFLKSYIGQTSPHGARVSRPGSHCRDSERLGLFRGRQAGIHFLTIAIIMTQLEYEKELADLNSERVRKLKLYRDRLDQIDKECLEINIQIKELRLKQDYLNLNRVEVLRLRRAVDDVFKERKRQMMHDVPDAANGIGEL